MEFRILGPLEAHAGGRALNLGGLRQRRILAALLLHANRPVSLGRLVASAWDEPPPTADRQVRNRIAALRAILTRAGGVIETYDDGYRLRVAPGGLDAWEFDRLVEEARLAARSGDPAAALKLLRAALALWRGPALADVRPSRPAGGGPAGDRLEGAAAGEPAGGGPAGDRLEGAAAAYDERRLAAIEDRVELDLAALEHRAGVDDGLIEELRVLVAEHPLRERLVGQLMTVLDRAGRRAEALAVYRELADRLSAELGIDPSPELRRRHDAVLKSPESSERTVRPAQLPADVSAFTGRHEDLATLDRILADGYAEGAVLISAVAGTAGVGKTALAVRWAHRVRDKFPDGQLYVNLRGYAPAPPVRPIDALAGFLRALGVPAERVPTDTAAASAAYRDLLADRRVLVLLDNAASADQVAPLLPRTAGCLVLVTSRDHLSGLAASGIRLDVLAPDESLALLTTVLGDDRVGAEPAASAELARLCAHLPLALRIAAANLAGAPAQRVAEYVDELRADNRLAALAVDGDQRAAVRAAFDLSYAALPPPARRLFRLLGLVPGPDLTPAASAALAGVPAHDARELLERLARAHLIDRRDAGRYTIHDLLRLYAAEHAAADGERDAARTRLYDYYVGGADAAARALYPHFLRLPVPPLGSPPPITPTSGSDASGWFEAERRNLVAAVTHAAAHGPHPAACVLADILRGYFFLRRYFVDWLGVAQAGLAAARAAGDRRAEGAAHISLAHLHWRRSEYERAIEEYDRAVPLMRETGWLEGQATALGNLGALHWQAGRLDLAIDHLARALAINRESGWLSGQLTNLANLGLVYGQMGRLAEAAEHSGQALVLTRQLSVRSGEAAILSNLGEIHHLLGRLDSARRHLENALAVHREVTSRGNEVDTLCSLSAVHRDAGDLGSARELARTALSLAPATGEHRLEADALHAVGAIHADLGEHHQAIGYYTRAVERAGTAEAHARVRALIGLANARRRIGEHRSAVADAEQAVSVARAAAFRVLEGQALTALAAAYTAVGDRESAIATAERALAIHRETGHRPGEALALQVLGDLAHQVGSSMAGGETPP